jgi:hypothetical protein
MVVFCQYCKKTHDENMLCDYIQKEIRQNPSIISDAANFVGIAWEYRFITSQDLSMIIQNFEGTQQTAFDIQVLRRLNEEAYKRAGYFKNSKTAKEYYNNATESQRKGLRMKLSGSGQEVNNKLLHQGKIRSIFEKYNLLTGNEPGIDAVIVNPKTGEVVKRITIKAAQSKSGINTNVQDIIESLKKGFLRPDDAVVGVKGTKDALIAKLEKEIAFAKKIGDSKNLKILQEAKKHLEIIEQGTPEAVKEYVKRLEKKIAAGQATTVITSEQIFHNVVQGSIIGGAIGLTISSITNYVRYINGEISFQEAFNEIGEDTVKSAITGGTMGGITLFLPVGAIGFISSFGIGIYLDATLTNILDEIFGKGFFRELLIAEGNIMVTSYNLKEALEQIKHDFFLTDAIIESIQYKMDYSRKLIIDLEKKQEEFNEW